MRDPEKYQQKYRIPSARHQNWNYGWNAAYFITICTKDREYYFGDVKAGDMDLSEIGELARKFWLEIPTHFPFVELDAFVIMPNHMHGIIIIDNPDNVGSDNVEPDNVGSDNVETRQCLVSTNSTFSIDGQNPDNKLTFGQKRYKNQGKNTLSSIIGSYKSVVSKHARKHHADFGWQSRFHDHIIRDAASHIKIANYILNNPANWEEDKFFKS